MTKSLKVDLDRLRNDLLELAKIGRNPEDQGVYRPAFSDADMEARRWLVKKIQAAGGEAEMDPAGNVVGRWFPQEGVPSVVIGSHIDSVLAGGMFDGTLGVLAGLECVRALQDAGITSAKPIEVVAFADEEGRFGGMFGVQAFCGKVTPEWINTAHDINGVRIADAMEAKGLDPMAALNAARPHGSVERFLELHIEQGPVLDQEDIQIGVVEGISGVFKWAVRLIGKANHAGTAPMNMRSDAFMGLADFAHEIERIIQEDGTETSRLTVGKVELRPGNPHTVPGEVDFSLVGRDMTKECMENLAHSCRKVLSAIARKHNLKFEFDQLSWLDPFPCSQEVMDRFCVVAQQLGLRHKVMPSGAGHDTQFMAEFTEAGMIFVPSVGGISHAPDEMTNWPDIENGANVLLNTLVSYVLPNGTD